MHHDFTSAYAFMHLELEVIGGATQNLLFFFAFV
jgi:hypothetical protein